MLLVISKFLNIFLNDKNSISNEIHIEFNWLQLIQLLHFTEAISRDLISCM